MIRVDENNNEEIQTKPETSSIVEDKEIVKKDLREEVKSSNGIKNIKFKKLLNQAR